MHNILVNQGVIEGKKKNVLPKKSPIIDEEAIKKAEEEAKAKAEAEAAAKAEAEAATEESASDDVKVDVVADEDDPTDHSEVAEESEEEKKKKLPPKPRHKQMQKLTKLHSSLLT